MPKLDMFPKVWKLFPASSQKQFDFIKRVIDRCDYYVLIVGGRYGSLADSNISFTEMEYEYALGKNISVSAFPHGEPDRIEVGKTERIPENAERLQRFRDRISHGALVDYWRTADELSMKVVVALGQEVTINPGIGWIRGSQAIDPKIYQELETTRRERDDLRSKLETNLFLFPAWLPKPESTLAVELRSSITKTTRTAASFGKADIEIIYENSIKIETTWNEILKSCGYEFFQPVPEYYFMRVIAECLCKVYMKDMPTSFSEADGFLVTIEKTFSISLDFKKIRDYFMSSDILNQINNNGSNGTYLSYELSDKGRKYVSYLNADRDRAVLVDNST